MTTAAVPTCKIFAVKSTESVHSANASKLSTLKLKLPKTGKHFDPRTVQAFSMAFI